MSSIDRFVLSPELDPQALLVKEGLDFVPYLVSGESGDHLYMDTFDWRLTAKGGPLRLDRSAGSFHAVREDWESGANLASEAVEAIPQWPQDLPEGQLGNGVRKATRIRALFPLVRVTSHRWTLAVLNEESQTVVWLLVEEPAAHRPTAALAAETEPRALGRRLVVRSVEGYERERRAIAAALETYEGVEPAVEPLCQEALAALGCSPGDYSSKINVPLSPDMRADAAARAIHRHLLSTLEANITGTCADLDSEFLHDLRVATRRTRSALTQIKGVYLPEPLEGFKERFRWLGQVTGPTRDLDVFLLGFNDYRGLLPESLRDDLEPYRGFLESRRRREQIRLRKCLQSPHFRKLIKEWRDCLDSPLPDKPEAPHALRSSREVADERIWKMFRRVLKEGRAITDDSPHEDIHELRKSCKKLRYLMEFFQALYPEKKIRPLIGTIKDLLDNLGEFQALEVHAHQIQTDAEAMVAAGEAPTGTLLAMGALVDRLLERQARARAQFDGRFSAFDTKTNRKAYKALFRPPKRQKTA